MNKPSLLTVLEHKTIWPPPIWLMRQAGRYLPEYRAIRAKAGSFWTMCMTPELAVEVTLQPIRRYNFDAAILFSDILVIPFALGQAVRFEENHGPILDAMPGVEKLERSEKAWQERLSPVYEAMSKTKSLLPRGKAMIGFAGAPWTLAAYMLEGKGSPDQRKAKLAAYSDPAGFARLLDVLAEAVAWHLLRQFEAGADVVQIFDSWAGGLPDKEFSDLVVAPNKKVISLVRSARPDAKIIGFPRAATQSGYERYTAETGADAIGIDTAASMHWAATKLGGHVAIQGNLDPIALIAGGTALDAAVDRILDDAKGTPFIFNLGHGVLPETPLDHVGRVVERVRSRE
jgi:uroporphyrinogen decarboxylase